MQVKEFIIKYGIEALKEQPIESNGETYKIQLDEDDISFHSINNKDWGNDKERLDRYHNKGSYRFYAKNNQDRCIWVYGSTKLSTPDESINAIQENNKILNFIKEWQSKNDYNPLFLEEYNSKFNAEFKHFLDSANVSQGTKDFYLS